MIILLCKLNKDVLDLYTSLFSCFFLYNHILHINSMRKVVGKWVDNSYNKGN